VKAESKTKELFFFFTEAHPNFTERSDVKLVKAEDITKRKSIFILELLRCSLTSLKAKLVTSCWAKRNEFD